MIDEWLRANRAPIFPRQTNEWIFAIRAEPGVAQSDSEIEQLVRRTLDKIVPGAGRSDTRLVSTSTDRIAPTEGTELIRESLPLGPAPALGDGSVVFAKVQFPSRGPLENVPWVSKRVVAGLPIGDAITNADIMLDTVATPIGEAGEEPTFLDDIFDGEPILPGIPELTTTTGIGIAVGAAVGVGILLLWKHR